MNKTIIKLSAFAAAAVLLTGCGLSDSYELQDSEMSQLQIYTEASTEAETETEAVTEKAEDTTDAETEAVTEAETTVFDDYSDDTYVEYHFRSKKLLEQHFEKHGGEFESDFGYKTAQDYESGASDVINNHEALSKTEKEDGDFVYYIESTNEFVILSTDGYIRTYFRPSAGKKYYDRQ